MNNDLIPAFLRSTTIAFVLLLTLAAPALAQIEWRPVTQAELDMKTPVVEPDADAEAIFWEVRLDNKKLKKLAYEHYVRVKIFTDRGRERFSKFDIPFYKDKEVENVAARVIRPDGSIVNISASDVFEREIARVGKESLRAKSFAVPNLAPGVIVEYQYREIFKNDTADGERLPFQRDVPVQTLRYYVRANEDIRLDYLPRNMDTAGFMPGEDGFDVATRTNVPSFREEPYMPPEDEVKQWAQLRYRYFGGFSWYRFGRQMSLYFDEVTLDQKDVKQKAAEIIAGSASDEESVNRIFDFTRRQIRNISYDRSMTNEQRRNIENKKASDTLKRGMGDAGDINLLFAALVRAAGYEASFMVSGDRSDAFFDPQRDVSPAFIHPSGIAVSLSGKTMTYNPGIPYMPAGMTFWREQAVSTMLVSNGGFQWGKLLSTDYRKSVSKRTARFKLAEDGSLEGLVRVEYSGHAGITRRGELYRKTPAEREESVLATWRKILPAGELSALSIENMDDPAKPLTITFKARVANYAQKTGKRLFFQPAFFEYGAPQVFATETRKYPIYFQFPWSEDDTVEIEVPAGYEADSLELPPAVRESGGLGGVEVNLEFLRDENVIRFRRNFFFGAKGQILFPASAYKPLKTLFDSIQKVDGHVLSLKSTKP